VKSSLAVACNLVYTHAWLMFHIMLISCRGGHRDDLCRKNRVIEDFTKSPNVTQDHLKVHHLVGCV